MRLDKLLSVGDFERKARSILPKCVMGYAEGATEDGLTLESNAAALRAWSLRPRALVDVGERDQSVELWGRRYESPFAIAPIGLGAMFRHRFERDLAAAAKKHGIPFILSGLSNLAMEEVVATSPDIWYQGYLPGRMEILEPLLTRLEANRIGVIVVTVDAPVAANRENNERNGFRIPFRLRAPLVWDGLCHPRWLVNVFLRTAIVDRRVPRFCNVNGFIEGYRITDEPNSGFRSGRDRLTWQHLEWMRERWKGRIVIKGISHPEDAVTAERLGLDAVVVSNHGGRQLDAAQASLAALPAVVGAVSPGFPVLVDGGFRRGTDILKAVALGARMVLLGRAAAYGAAVGGEDGAARVLTLLSSEVDRNLALLGCRDLRSLDSDVLVRTDA